MPGGWSERKYVCEICGMARTEKGTNPGLPEGWYSLNKKLGPYYCKSHSPKDKE